MANLGPGGDTESNTHIDNKIADENLNLNQFQTTTTNVMKDRNSLVGGVRNFISSVYQIDTKNTFIIRRFIIQ